MNLKVLNGDACTAEEERQYNLYNVLRQGPKKVSELKDIINKSQPTLSIRLKRMAEEGLVIKQNGYWLVPTPRLKILELIEDLKH